MNFDILEQIENTSGSVAKSKLLLKFIESSDNAEEYLRIMFNDDVYGLSDKSIEKALGIVDFPKEKDCGTKAMINTNGSIDINFNDFKKQLRIIKELTGKDLIKFLNICLSGIKPIQLKWIIRLLLKNPHCGISIKTVNKIFVSINKPKIEKFEVQLCGKIKSVDEWPEFPCISGIKYDGFRAIVEKKGDVVTITSRQGKNVEYIPELIEYFSKFDCNFMLDGEILADNFNLIQKRIGKKLDNIEEVRGLHFRCFDILKFNNTSFLNVKQKDRIEFIEINFKETDLFKLEEYKWCHNAEELKEFYEMAKSRNEEGIVIKSLEAKYDYGSRKNWYKVKPVYENTFKVIGAKFGNGKNVQKISTLIISDLNGRVISGVSSGLTDYDMDRYTELYNDDKINNILVEVAYYEISKNSEGKYSLRNPSFLKERNDIDEADEITHDTKGVKLI